MKMAILTLVIVGILIVPTALALDGFGYDNVEVPHINDDDSFTQSIADVLYCPIDGSCIDLTTTFNASAISTIAGTHDEGNLLSIQRSKDGNSYNVSEVGGTPALTIHINFTNITSFTTILLRERYEGGAGHEIKIGLLECASGIYEEEYDPVITDMTDFAFTVRNVVDSTSHVCNGNVSLQLRHVEAGNPTHNFYLDYAVLQKGPSTVATEESDPHSLYKDGTIKPTGDFYWGSNSLYNVYNVNATYYYGNATKLKSINCSEIIGGTDTDFCADAEGGAGDNLGDHVATQNINLDGNKIGNVARVNMTNGVTPYYFGYDAFGYPGFFSDYGNFFFGIGADPTTYVNYDSGATSFWVGYSGSPQNIQLYGNVDIMGTKLDMNDLPIENVKNITFQNGLIIDLDNDIVNVNDIISANGYYEAENITANSNNKAGAGLNALGRTGGPGNKWGGCLNIQSGSNKITNSMCSILDGSWGFFDSPNTLEANSGTGQINPATGSINFSTASFQDLRVASCDVKASSTNGTLYCGTDAGAGGGDDLGDHVATTRLDMATNNINNVGNINTSNANLGGDVWFSVAGLKNCNTDSEKLETNSVGLMSCGVDANAGSLCGNGYFLNGDYTCDAGYLDADGVDSTCVDSAVDGTCDGEMCTLEVVDGCVTSIGTPETPYLYDWNGTFLRKVAHNLLELKGDSMIPLINYTHLSNFTFTIKNWREEREYFDYVALNLRCHLGNQMRYETFYSNVEELGKDNELYLFLDQYDSGSFTFDNLSLPAWCVGADFRNWQLEIRGYYENI